MKNADSSTRLKDETSGSQKTVQTDQTSKNPDDARDESQAGDVDQGKLRENRDKLGVDEVHRTDDMERGNRGTFP